MHRDLTDADIQKIADTYHAWRGDGRDTSPKRKRGNTSDGAGAAPKPEQAGYKDMPGFCKSGTLVEMRHRGHILTPGRYVGAAEVEDDDEKMKRLSAELREQSKNLDKLIWANLKEIGYGA